jgi:hypothetical protein
MSAYIIAIGLKITHRRLGWNMQVKTWLQRLTDESNLWFSAVKAEDDGDFVAAASSYVEDASQCLERNLVRAALSCNCAGSCLTKLGAPAQACTLFELAAKIYMENSGIAMSESIREAMWSMQEAAENFTLAGDYAEASKVRNKYLALASRTNPFAQPARSESGGGVSSATPTALTGKQARLPQDLVDQIARLVEAHRRLSVHNEDAFDAGYVLRAIDSSGGSKLSEKSIAS